MKKLVIAIFLLSTLQVQAQQDSISTRVEGIRDSLIRYCLGENLRILDLHIKTLKTDTGKILKVTCINSHFINARTIAREMHWIAGFVYSKVIFDDTLYKTISVSFRTLDANYRFENSFYIISKNKLAFNYNNDPAQPGIMNVKF